jgi:N-acyl-D-amino-acid deacylase
MIRTDRGMLDGRVLIASSVPHPECAGRDLGDIAKEWGVAESEAARRMQPGTAIYFLMDEPDVQRILAFDETMIGSTAFRLARSRTRASGARSPGCSATTAATSACSRSRPRSGR